ncbi:VOC family protein [Streptomyces canus]|uniref:VOC family protein n=1 Tax=Streptomyces canus TaxID=58343 RepID=UPI00037ACBE2|nr:VOC family protein [Streptomyces canus]
MITLTDIAYVRSGAADLEKATRFATEIVGLQQVGTEEPGVAHLRADQRHHCLALVEGRSGVIASAFTLVGEDELTSAETELEQRGIRVTRGGREAARSRHVTEFIAFDDPFGNRVELVTGQETMAEPVRLARPSSGISEFGHICFDAPDVREAHRFWSTTFNARVSDWIGESACLMRIDRVHHKLAVFRGDGPGLCHINFQTATLDDLFRNWNFLRANAVDIVMGPGKHPTSGSVFLYFRGPEGITYEYATGGLPIDEATWVTRTFDAALPASLDMWQGPVSRPSTQPQLPSS